MPPETFGAMICRARKERGWSQSRLAEELAQVSGRSTVTRQEVYRWEKGRRVPRFWLPHIATALDIPRDRLERAIAANGASDDSPDPAATLTTLLPDGDPLTPLTASTGRRVGAQDARDLAARVHGLRLADDVLAGRDLVSPARRELAAALRLYQEGRHTEAVGRSLLVAIGELAQIVGWIESDAGHHDRAEATYRLGVSAAREAGDLTLAGNVAGSLAYQWTNTGRQREGLALARAALDDAGPDAPGKARALFFDRVAWAHASIGEAQAAMRALEHAHEALVAAEPEAAPEWAYWVSEDELRVMDARVYTELRRPLRAVPLLRDVLNRYNAAHARELALYLSWLAVAYADANEPEAAAETTARMFALSADVASDRTAERSQVVLCRLADFEDVPEVRAVLGVA
ncbi:DNA-binding transcriptional regulator, XRE-family HTH domain [Marinactinospora thermotolerans DSM 45154]|uniref:DNA-binding transcriptional regulator, XRE-family HTH domain n=1 Tax=Marinactinospora thermotolerans DSM 45154 TaxID=1122192 RepID=A0A1T4R8F8_9ACTN|nr:helix-turn-helix domain-containing protein [Marinactinospora thermotolerans]SKA11958.1 DNA-binding transcriptional regulator, XRE-family HTH domain [Marinactinospora thermotolerans DSM 45154]